MSDRLSAIPTGNGLTARERDVLVELAAACKSGAESAAKGYRASEWQRPLDVGGHNGSHHSYTLAKLAQRGLVERRKTPPRAQRGSCVYRITDFGTLVLDYLHSGQPASQWSDEQMARRVAYLRQVTGKPA